MKKEDQDKLSIYFKDVRKYKVLPEEELVVLFNDNQFDKIILHNQRLIISIAQKYPYISLLL
jgi:hypothetical protein